MGLFLTTCAGLVLWIILWAVDVKPFDAKGQPFDPKVHEAVSKVPSTATATSPESGL